MRTLRDRKPLEFSQRSPREVGSVNPAGVAARQDDRRMCNVSGLVLRKIPA
jgi:hypothetical protein